MADITSPTDPLGNREGTVRGLLSVLFGACMVAVVLMNAYRIEIMDKPFVSPDALTVAFFFTGTTIIGMYFGLRVRQGATGLPSLTGDVSDQGTVNINMKTEPASPAAKTPAEDAAETVERLGTLADLHALENDPQSAENADKHFQVS